MSIGLIGRKVGMTQVFAEDGTMVPVSVVAIEPNTVTLLRTQERDGYTATKHQREVGTGYFDEVAQVISGGKSSTVALKESTEAEQF